MLWSELLVLVLGVSSASVIPDKPNWDSAVIGAECARCTIVERDGKVEGVCRNGSGSSTVGSNSSGGRRGTLDAATRRTGSEYESQTMLTLGWVKLQ